ncbi:GDSL-type esterase/lipase family protein, partial [Leifsonia kafniensis]|uniref:GDSL-type esterase/lipase family protein n=1 Tax=Leifsonia kafniensis TaxID=475957 RepID=UPI0031F08C0E
MRDKPHSVLRQISSAALSLALVGGLFALGSAPASAAPASAATTVPASSAVTAVAAAPDGWLSSWAQSQDRVSGITFTNVTFRMITHLSQGGDQLRIRLQNQYGAGPITVNASSIALTSKGMATVAGTHRALAFAGQSSVTIPKGGEVWSDSVALETKAQDDIAVSMFVQGPMIPSLHSYPYINNYSTVDGAGNTTTDESGSPFTRELPYTYLVSAVDVHNTELDGTIVAYGSSVVDGEGSQNCGMGCSALGTNRRWSDELARRINSELPADAQVAIANAGIGGTTASPACSGGGNDGINRLDRDVLALHGVTAVIYYYGTNDLSNNCTATSIIDSYKNVFQRLRAAGIKIYVTPITPRPSYTEPQNVVRSAVNSFVRTDGNCSGTCDAILDFDAVLKDPTNANSIYPPYNTGDNTHANVAGQQAIANSISLPLLASSGLPAGAPLPVLKNLSKYDFEDGFQGWRAGSNVGSVGWISTFANGPKAPFAGKRVMDANSLDVHANLLRTIFVTPPEPLDASAHTELVAHIDSHGGITATGYEAVITLTGAGGDVLTRSFPMAADAWNTIRLDVSGWAARSAVSKIEIGFHALGVTGPGNWIPHFQIDDVAWNAAPVITSGDPGAGTVGSAYAFTVAASGNPAPTFSVTAGALPAGLSLDATTGVISGTPTSAESATFTVTAS